MMRENVLPRLAEMVAVHVDQPSATGTFQVEMLTAVVCVLHVLVARAAGFVDDVLSHLAAFRK